MTDFWTPPESDEERRMKIVQAMMQQKPQGGGYMQVLAQLAQAAAQQKLQQQAQETRENKRLGVNPIAPAFDDQGYSLPRAPGMQQPSAWQSLQNWFSRGGE